VYEMAFLPVLDSDPVFRFRSLYDGSPVLLLEFYVAGSLDL
jgi:hypothetical protein